MCVALPGGCTTDAQCAAPTPHCRQDTHTCVACTMSSQCPAGDQCVDDQCVGFCGSGQHCGAGLDCCPPLCVDTQTDPTNCGACGTVCGPYPSALSVCVAGTCGLGGCLPGFSDCDGVLQNGCEIETASDPQQCGSCTHRCSAGDDCASGTCTAPCDSANCPGSFTCCGILCADTTSDLNNCGGCGVLCGPIPHGDTTCLDGACVTVACLWGFADCDGEVQNGCEVDTRSDAANCGTCGNACAPGSFCVVGTCQPGSCAAGAPCPDGTMCCGDTCVDTNIDLFNCGACQVSCAFPTWNLCKGGQCCNETNGGPEVCGEAACAPRTYCGAECVDTKQDTNNCGGCGLTCGSAVECSNGTCICGGEPCPEPGACCAKGCTDVMNDPNNCGQCNLECPPGIACVGGQCGCGKGPPCSPGLLCCGASCIDWQTDPNNCGTCGDTCTGGSVCVAGSCSG